jgi:hypothetical protein
MPSKSLLIDEQGRRKKIVTGVNRSRKADFYLYQFEKHLGLHAAACRSQITLFVAVDTTDWHPLVSPQELT